MTIQDAVINFKQLINDSIISGGNKAKTAMIRSSKPILNIHEAVKHELINRNINQSLFYPPLHNRSPEMKLAGALKQKNQDVCVRPNNINPIDETLIGGLLDNIIDPYGYNFTEKTLVINVRSQISSIQKNFDTLFERTYAEAQNLHERCPNIVLGEVYLLAVPEYDDTFFGLNQIAHKRLNQQLVEKYIKSFSAISNRVSIKGKYYKYESTCLLIVDFSQSIPKIYNTTQGLINDGLLSAIHRRITIH
jgi:hypothetical protein